MADVSGFIGRELNILKLPVEILKNFEPSQIGTITGTLVDACLPNFDILFPDMELFQNKKILKHEGLLGEREGYPDYKHINGLRLELKMIYLDPIDIEMKIPPTPREPSARLTQKVTIKNVLPDYDLLLLLCYRMKRITNESLFACPTIMNCAIFPMIECIKARDKRLIDSGGKWFGDFETPAILSNRGKDKLKKGISLDSESYGRKESENHDYNEDTNFGKLKRIPYKPLQEFLMKIGANYMSSGNYPIKWNLE
ncbi:MAG: hypothetical protein FWE58_03375 [Methanobrevibacter sp.]|nr:hypothetical protein [Methanobrevibacter sp.]